MKSRFVWLAVCLLLALPALAANDCIRIQNLSADDVQTGEAVTITWSYDGGQPSSQTLSGHDFPEPVVLPPGQTSYSYTPSMPGEKHVQLAAVTACGTVSRSAKYHVKKCPVVEPVLTVTPASVAPGETISASLDLLPGHTAQWVVTNGTASATTGSAIQVTADAPGTLVIDAYVSKGSACSVKVSATVTVIEPCSITEPAMYPFPEQATASEVFSLWVPARAGETTTFEVENADVLYVDAQNIVVFTPATGSFSIDIIVSNGTCTRTFTRRYEVQPCQATATVSAGAGDACGATTVVADFTGTAPFQGAWSDGEYFFTYDSHLERSVSVAGTYTLLYFRDNFCAGTISGSAQAGASLPTPVFMLDEVVDGWYYGNDTCPGMVRTVRLTDAIPAGAEIVWSVENGSIIAGQGTAVMQFAGTNPGPSPVTAVFRNAEGCESAPYTNQWILTHGAPEASVSVEPATIPAGGTAIVTVTNNPYVRGFSVTSSLGDTITLVGSNNLTSTWEYRSSHGGGTATIDVTTQNVCGQTGSASATLTIDGSNPVAATATVRAIGSRCGEYAALAEFTGTAPFSGTWSNGQTFVTSDPLTFLWPSNGGTYTLVEFSDANGPGNISGSATFDFVPLPRPDFVIEGPAGGCPNSVVTATLIDGLPEGGSAQWDVFGATILSGQGTASIQIQTGTEPVFIQVMTSAPGACSTEAAYQQLDLSCGMPRPSATLTATPAALCGAEVTVTFTGTAPFTATWNDGVTFTTNESTYTRVFQSTQWVYLSSVADANRTDGYPSNWVYAEATLPPYVNFSVNQSLCRGGTVTATAVDVPAGYGVTWVIEGTNARIVSGQGTPEAVVEGLEAGSFGLFARLLAPNGCEGPGSGAFIEVNECP